MKILGLSHRRLKEWKSVLKSELKTANTAFTIFCITKASFTIFGRGKQKWVWRRRIRICMNCPIYNPETKACRNGEDGCGCYVPYKAMTKGPCWGRENVDLPDFGWE